MSGECVKCMTGSDKAKYGADHKAHEASSDGNARKEELQVWPDSFFEFICVFHRIPLSISWIAENLKPAIFTL